VRYPPPNRRAVPPLNTLRPCLPFWCSPPPPPYPPPPPGLGSPTPTPPLPALQVSPPRNNMAGMTSCPWLSPFEQTPRVHPFSAASGILTVPPLKFSKIRGGGGAFPSRLLRSPPSLRRVSPTLTSNCSRDGCGPHPQAPRGRGGENFGFLPTRSLLRRPDWGWPRPPCPREKANTPGNFPPPMREPSPPARPGGPPLQSPDTPPRTPLEHRTKTLAVKPTRPSPRGHAKAVPRRPPPRGLLCESSDGPLRIRGLKRCSSWGYGSASTALKTDKPSGLGRGAAIPWGFCGVSPGRAGTQEPTASRNRFTEPGPRWPGSPRQRNRERRADPGARMPGPGTLGRTPPPPLS